MPRTVYILGAGFSHNFNNETFPLVRNFLSLARSRLVFQPDNRHWDLAVAIRTYFGHEEYPNIEKVLSFLAATPLYNRRIQYEHRSKLYDDLVKVIIDLLSQTKTEAENSFIGETYKHFAQFLVQSEVTVISFNYDLLIEELLEGTYKWRRNDGYGAHIPLAHKAMPTSPHTFLQQATAEDTDTKWSKATVLPYIDRIGREIGLRFLNPYTGSARGEDP